MSDGDGDSENTRQVGAGTGSQGNEPLLGQSSASLVATVGGSSTRKYLNEEVTPALLRGMRLIAVEQPENPLKRLGEYLIEQSGSK
ncbi:Sdc1p KNAG_0C06080 [Huiozyma naganishii CBS 8797]|uniref:Uncharacterized protein n=1 Tax=Huiozyma naganishii (strain ATCC MYA-139 / BCRC 22969 / CBS 8797 / KCTC 17520 / NBRC 10181 / NCYC 3082 / Yp74L-3) TaxID=1071383 RepID=J7R4C8_HUIN7|nr:hypothetical protein KNAG_0C06080 [Kazachstania naganishii CBS 8797]CCK69705.1 hypothetical protein KNAG_0C06080 [Kazachstania naganishii CBS 8797]